MPLIPGTDSYASLAEADTYVTDHYLSTDPIRVAWEALDDADKEALLRGSCLAIESLAFTGIKLNFSQPLQFPRQPDAVYDSFHRDWQNIDWSYVDYVSEDLVAGVIPQEVKYAQTETALAMTSTNSSDVQRLKLQQQGVTSFRIGDLSETYGKIGSSNIRRLGSEKANTYLSKWTNGGYKVR
jgi:hypothetical protein